MFRQYNTVLGRRSFPHIVWNAKKDLHKGKQNMEEHKRMNLKLRQWDLSVGFRPCLARRPKRRGELSNPAPFNILKYLAIAEALRFIQTTDTVELGQGNAEIVQSARLKVPAHKRRAVPSIVSDLRQSRRLEIA
jgi:hypothetical protein